MDTLPAFVSGAADSGSVDTHVVMAFPIHTTADIMPDVMMPAVPHPIIDAPSAAASEALSFDTDGVPSMTACETAETPLGEVAVGSALRCITGGNSHKK